MNEELGEWIGREEYEQHRRFYAEQMKNILIQLEDVKRKITMLNPRPQLAPQTKDLLDKQVTKALNRLAYLEKEIINMKKGGQ